MPYAVSPLPYAYDALEPVIDRETMHLHHDKHHEAYVTNLNKALEGHAAFQNLPIVDLLLQLSDLPESIRMAVRNNGGSHVNHETLWKTMGAPHDDVAPGGSVGAAIVRDFGSYDAFKASFQDAGLKQFGSGWAFVTVDTATGKLAVTARPNQDTPLMENVPVLFTNDVWEHAYYLNYRNRRGDYLATWWKVANWNEINRRYDAIMAGQRVD